MNSVYFSLPALSSFEFIYVYIYNIYVVFSGVLGVFAIRKLS